jgi:hypothetical protein
MLTSFFLRAIVATASIALPMVNGVAAEFDAASCPQKYLAIGDRNLAFATSGSKVEPLDVETLFSSPIAAGRNAPGTQGFYYIVPATSHDRGVLIVKSRHVGQPYSTRFDPKYQGSIRLTRDAYAPRCVNLMSDRTLQQRFRQAFYDRYDQTVSIQDFVNYHYYRILREPADPNNAMDRFHAELGERVVNALFSQRRVCTTTDFGPILGQFLFDEFRVSANVYQSIVRIAAAATRIVATPVQAAAAETPSYRGYLGLAATVIPYKKEAGSAGCVAFSIKIPTNFAKIEQSEVMVIDADDALIATRYANPSTPAEYAYPRSIQKSWMIQWQQH